MSQAEVTDLAGDLSDLRRQPQQEYGNYPQELSGTWLQALCLHGGQGGMRGWETLVTQVSPQGGDGFEDQPVLDASDPAAWMLVVVVRDNDGLRVLRRLFHDGKEIQ